MALYTFKSTAVATKRVIINKIMDKDGYPEDEKLATIISWDAIADPLGLVDYIQELWAYADAGHFTFDSDTGKLELHTAGWSGNEELIGALQENTMFWIMYWQRSERGGHHYLIVRKVPD
jgi:hypothetical protein